MELSCSTCLHILHASHSDMALCYATLGRLFSYYAANSFPALVANGSGVNHFRYSLFFEVMRLVYRHWTMLPRLILVIFSLFLGFLFCDQCFERRRFGGKYSERSPIGSIQMKANSWNDVP